MLHDVNNWRKYTCIAPLKSYNSIKFNIDKLFDGGQYKILRRYRGVVIKCLKVEILDVRLQLEDGPPPQLNVIKEDATVKVVFTPTFSINPLKNAR